jgi:tetratricopeptide (TPR) repeat protein
MKVAVYTIAKNEEQFVERWFNSAKDADYLLIADTGSTDKTIKLAKSFGINVYSINVNPFRFDDARNAALALIPADIDYCMSVDMDEVLSEGWRQQFNLLPPGTTRPMVRQATNIKDGKPEMTFKSIRAHARNGFRWKHPVHEACVSYLVGGIEARFDLDIDIMHLPDDSKPRSQYLPMLQMATQEEPNDERMSYYYGRELFFRKKYDEAIKELNRYLELPSATWNPERAYAMRYLAKCDPDNKEMWLIKAYEEFPESRDAIVDLAEYYYLNQEWQKCLEAAEKALSIKEKSLDYFTESYAWEDTPYDLAALACYNLGLYDKAVEYGKIAIEYKPDDERLRGNLEFYTQTHNPQNGII